jgi:branched-chain amino acid transport system substrate-binding protein
VLILNSLSASMAGGLKPAGLEKSVGVISATFLKDISDPVWKDDAATSDWLAFKDKYYRGEDGESAALYGYTAAETLAQALKQCGDDLSRENVMQQAAALKITNRPSCCRISR